MPVSRQVLAGSTLSPTHLDFSVCDVHIIPKRLLPSALDFEMDLSMFCQSNLLYTQESLSRYKPGGYHPVNLEILLKVIVTRYITS